MKVAWFDTEELERNRLQSQDHGLEIDYFDRPLNNENVKDAEGYDVVSVFVSSNLDEETVENLECDVVACRSTGFDHVNLEAASRNGISVLNVPEYGSTTVAEHTFGLILSLSRKIYSAIRKVKEGEFNQAGLRGFDLEDKKLGVIGTGSIGQHVIRMAKGFNMDVIAYDPYPKNHLEEDLGFMYVSMDDLLEQSDIISLHCPLTDENHHLLSEEEFSRMDNTVVVNTSRGELVDTESLIKALDNGSVRSAGLDVLEEECYIEDDVEYLGKMEDCCKPETVLQDHILMNREDVLITPHNAFNSEEAMERIVDQTIENIRERKNVVN